MMRAPDAPMAARRILQCFLLAAALASQSRECFARAAEAAGAGAHPSDLLEGDMCANLAKGGKCESEPDLMAKYCAGTYAGWVDGRRKTELRRQKRDVKAIEDDGTSPTFYDLSASTDGGETLSFETFEGYVSLVAFVPKACDGGVAAEETLQSLRSVRSKWPRVVAVVAFPFEHPSSHYYATELDAREGECSSDHYRTMFNEGSGQTGGDGQSAQTLIKSMEEISIEGISGDPSGSTVQHPVYKYFKGVFGFDTISATSPTVFLVSPDGDVAEVFFDGSGTNIENSIREHIKHEL